MRATGYFAPRTRQIVAIHPACTFRCCCCPCCRYLACSTLLLLIPLPLLLLLLLLWGYTSQPTGRGPQWRDAGSSRDIPGPRGPPAAAAGPQGCPGPMQPQPSDCCHILLLLCAAVWPHPGQLCHRCDHRQHAEQHRERGAAGQPSSPDAVPAGGTQLGWGGALLWCAPLAASLERSAICCMYGSALPTSLYILLNACPLVVHLQPCRPGQNWTLKPPITSQQCSSAP